MRVVIADCSAVYSGRGDTRLPRAVRAVLIKSDGCVSIHCDEGNKPLNYMGSDAVQSEETAADGTREWVFDSRKESLRITLYSIISDTTSELSSPEEGLQRDGTEAHVQAWLAENLHRVGEGLTLVQREYPTGHGPVDLLAIDQDGTLVAIEVKRVAMLGAVGQTLRYIEALREAHPDKAVRGVIAAPDIRPKTAALAEKRGVGLALLPAFREPTS